MEEVTGLKTVATIAFFAIVVAMIWFSLIQPYIFGKRTSSSKDGSTSEKPSIKLSFLKNRWVIAIGLVLLLIFVWNAGGTQAHVRMSEVRNEQLHKVFIPVGETRDAFAYAIYASGQIDLDYLESSPDITEITCGDVHHSWAPGYTEIDACDSLFYYICYDARKNRWGAINTNVPGQVLRVNVDAAKIRVWCQTMNPRYEGYNLRVYQRQGQPHKDPRKQQKLASRKKKN